MKLNEEQLECAVTSYLAENIRAHGKIVECVLEDDLDLRDVQFTSNMWDDGVPVTKMFDRNPTIDVSIPKGTHLKGVTYVGRATQAQMVDFYWAGMWISTSDDIDALNAFKVEV